MQALYNKFNKTKLIIAALLFCAYATLIVLSGGSVVQLFLFLLVVAVCVLCPGYLLYKLLRIEQYVEGFAYPIVFTLGSAVFAGWYMLCLALGAEFLLYVFTAGCACGVFIYLKKRSLLSKSALAKRLEITPQLSFITLVCTGLLLVYGFAGVVKYAHPALVGEIMLNQDFLWNVGNAQSFSLGLPPSDIRFAGVELRYHFFGELLCAAISAVSGIAAYNIIAFYSQIVFLPTLVVSLFLLGRYFYNSVFKANVFTLMIFGLSCLSLHKILPNGHSRFSNSFITSIITNVNSMAIALIFLSVFAVLLARLQRINYRANIGYYVATVLAFLLLCFSKSPIAAIVAIALACTLVAMVVFQRRVLWQEITLFLLLSGGFLLIYIMYFSAGAQASTGFDLDYTLSLGYFSNMLNRISIELPMLYPIAAVGFMVLQSFCMAPFTLPVFVLAAFSGLGRFRQLSSWQLVCFACGFGGFAAFFLSYHAAFSQVYFAYIAIFCITFIAVEHFSFAKLSIKTAAFYACLVLSVITSVFLYINLLGSGARQLMFNYDILPKYPYSFIVKADDEQAGAYLRSVMQKGDTFATNRVHTGVGEGLSNVYSAFSGMQGYMEGFKYTVSNMGLSNEVAMERYNFNAALFSGSLTHEEMLLECHERGIDYLVFSTQFEGGTEQFADFENVFSSETVMIYKVP